ncbi:AAA family ATPase [Aneurinibacillus terranovensis]|uniref:AAA family ATPase n=1 Tax=Aneurinibacillus terranovensis TaxID=278991 RepID=UPI00040E6659|nr:AAA family ATPase [Aneurinibacillus terranovensis]
MIISKIKIKNFKMFKDVEFEFDKQFTLIIGNNGTGKTSILEAVGVALGGYLSGLDGVQSRNIYIDEIRKEWDRVGDATVTKERQVPVTIESTGTINEREIVWTRSREKVQNGRTSRTKAKLISQYAQELQRKIRNKDQDVVLPIISYQSAGRLFSQKKNKWYDPFKKEDLSRFIGYTDCLEAESNIKLFVNWLRRMTTIQLQKNIIVGELTSVVKAVNEFMKGLSDSQEANIYYDFEEEEVLVEMGSKSIPLRIMSAGYRSVIGMVADIAYRMAILNPQLRDKATRETPGIVLIDELDLHLHPQWQWRIVNDLKRTFPNVQFIATTHAPIVISSCKEGEIINLQQDNGDLDQQNEKAPYGWLVEDILTKVMNTYPREPEVIGQIELIERLYLKSRKGELSSEEKEQLQRTTKHLYKILPPEDPAVTIAKIEAIGKKALGVDDND